MSSDNERVLEKIKKCMALSASSNEHEAAAALRQAGKLMEAHGISDAEVKASQVSEQEAKSGSGVKPPGWESALATKVADAFSCRLIFKAGWQGSWAFVGCGPAPEVASYVFSALRRQAKRARDEYIKARLKRCKTATKTRRADLYSQGWVRTVTGVINVFVETEEQAAVLDAYIALTYQDLGTLALTQRNAGRKLSGKEVSDFYAGCVAGRNAQLHHGVGGIEQQLLVGG